MSQPVSFFENRRTYVSKVVDPVVEDLVHDILTEMPKDPVEFSIAWMKRRMGSQKACSSQNSGRRLSVQSLNSQLKHDLRKTSETMAEICEAIATEADERPRMSRTVSFKGDSSESEEDDDDDVVDEVPIVVRSKGPRQSVSAEAYGDWNKVQNLEMPVHQKTAEQKVRLQKILSLSLLFSALEEEDLSIILNALEEKTFMDNERIINEGDDGDCLYVVERGSLQCKKIIDGRETVVKTCMPGDVFGELALLYMCVRQASVDASGTCVCWRLDRPTFNQVVRQGHAKRIEQYDEFVQNIGLFSTMEQAERSRIVECFKIARYKQGDVVVKQGDQGDCFFVVEEGQLAAKKERPGEHAQTVKEYGYGEYFGELALLKNQPRAATVIVTSVRAKLVWLDRRTFQKMLGPLQEILERRAASYA